MFSPELLDLPSFPAHSTGNIEKMGGVDQFTFMYNQAAGFCHCLIKVQDIKGTHLRVSEEEKVKLATKMQEATDEPAYLMTFIQSIAQAMVN